MKKARSSRVRKAISPARVRATLSARNQAYELITNLLDDDDLEKAKQAMLDCLSATKFVRVAGTKGNPVFEEVPDHQIRGWMGKAIYEFIAGKAKERHEHTVTEGSDDGSQRLSRSDLMHLIAQSPEMTRRILEDFRPTLKPSAIDIVEDCPPSVPRRQA